MAVEKNAVEVEVGQLNRSAVNCEARGEVAMQYAQQISWLISLYKLEYITEEEYQEARKRLNVKYHQTPRI